MNQIQKLETWKKDLALAETFEEIKLHDSVSAAAAEFARRNNLALEKQNEIGKFRVDVETKKGEWLNQNYPNGGKRGNQYKSARVEQDDSGKMPVSKDESSRARKIKNTEEEKLEQIMHEIEERGEVITPNNVHKEIRKKENIERREKIKDQFSQAPQLQSKKTYRVIYADPPWLYDKGKELSDSYGDVSKHYPPMELQDICDLPVSELCDKNSVLFLWATAPKLPEALEVMKAWGFEYKTNVIWDKVGHNFGYYFSVRHEILLIGGKGSSTPDNRKLHDSVISIEKSKKHSEKPQYFKELINTLYTEGNKIELFCRESSLNFDAWGNEITTI